ncbi:hypothetical protein JL720_15919 [Aureococcus anophagefferens]|nr:hypothetical protein JL720_15919 [Aureococcus anophagefferens]
MVTICLCLAGVVGATDLLREGRERAERYARCDRPRAEYRKYEAMTAGFGRSAPSWTAQKLLSAGGAVYVKNQKSGTHFVESLLGGPGARWYYQKFRNADPAAAWFANARFEREASRDPRSAALGCDARAPPPAVFTVVRDPFESFASAFLEAMCVERDGRGTFAGNRKPEFAAFAAPPRSGEGPSMTMSHDNATRLFERRRRRPAGAHAHRVDAAPPGCGGLRFIFALETAGDAIAALVPAAANTTRRRPARARPRKRRLQAGLVVSDAAARGVATSRARTRCFADYAKPPACR